MHIFEASFLLALRYATSQAGIAARILTPMQGSEEKKIKQRNANQTRAQDSFLNHCNTEMTLSNRQSVVYRYLTRVN